MTTATDKEDKKDMLLYIIKNKGHCYLWEPCGECYLLSICRPSETFFTYCIEEYIKLYGEQALKQRLVEELI